MIYINIEHNALLFCRLTKTQAAFYYNNKKMNKRPELTKMSSSDFFAARSYNLSLLRGQCQMANASVCLQGTIAIRLNLL